MIYHYCLGRLNKTHGKIVGRHLTLTRGGFINPFYILKLKDQDGGKVKMYPLILLTLSYQIWKHSMR